MFLPFWYPAKALSGNLTMKGEAISLLSHWWNEKGKKSAQSS